MEEFHPGEAVAIPATLQPGAFSGEFLVTVATATGPVSGFVRDRDMAVPQNAIHGVVHKVSGSTLSVQLSGSYFTTNGLAEFSTEWAKRNMKAIA